MKFTLGYLFVRVSVLTLVRHPRLLWSPSARAAWVGKSIVEEMAAGMRDAGVIK